MTYIQRFDRIPPKLCRLLARSGHGLRLMTRAEICERSGLNHPRVIQISRLPSWRTLPLKDIEAFSMACGVNLLAPGEQLKYLKRGKRAYLANATAGQRKMLAGLMSDLIERR